MFTRFILLLVCTSVSICCYGQVSVQFFPEIHGRTIDGLFNARIISGADQARVRLKIIIEEERAGQILTLQTEPFTLSRGVNGIPASAIRSASMQAGQGSVARLVQQNGFFPQGNYEYSFIITDLISVSNDEYEQTFQYELTPSAPLNLIEPYNEDKICDKKPVLSWQPYIPYISGVMYQLQMVEIKNQQNAVEALNYNLPVINQKGIMNSMMPYPSNSNDLQQGKKYAWQVTAYKDQTVLNRSEVWEFIMDCKDSVVATVPEDNGYRDIEDLAKGNYYVAKGYLNFAVVNSYGEQALVYSIVSLSNSKQKVRKLPDIKLKRGNNNITIDLSGNSHFKDENSYIINVKLPNGLTKSLRFIFREL